jgi:hypothetical protein
LTDDGLLTIVAAMLTVAGFVFFYAAGDYYQSKVPFFDYLPPITPNPYIKYWSYVWNWTWVHIFENSAVLTCCFLLRNYPKEFAVLKEMTLFLLLNFGIAWFFEFIRWVAGSDCEPWA